MLSYYGLIDAKIRASDKDLPVQRKILVKLNYVSYFFLGGRRGRPIVM